MTGILTILYGVIMAVGGAMAYVRVRSTPSLIGGSVIGALAVIGGAMLTGGNPTGRGIALAGAVLASLFFGWSLSTAIRSEGSVIGRPAVLLTLSLAVAALLVATR
jgi:uncharacterized membrane protein (UPF0136 family)